MVPFNPATLETISVPIQTFIKDGRWALSEGVHALQGVTPYLGATSTSESSLCLGFPLAKEELHPLHSFPLTLPCLLA